MKRPTVTITAQLGPRALLDVERAVIREAMQRNRGNITHAATMLGLMRQSLQRRLRRLKLRGLVRR